MTLTVDDVQKDVVERDSDGEILPETVEITYKGEPEEVKIYPPTLGDLNEYDNEIEDADFDSMDVAALKILCYKHYHTPNFKDRMPEEDFMDMNPLRVVELAEAFEPFIGAENAGVEGNDPMEMSRQERAQEMR